MPESEFRVELVEGLIVESPSRSTWHQKAAGRLTIRLDDQLPRSLTALAGVAVVLDRERPTVRVPDMIVTSSSVLEPGHDHPTAAEVRLCAEILSEATEHLDRAVKFAEYAAAGIPQYWIIDVGPPTTLLAYVLVGNTYELSDASTLEVANHRVTIDLDTLVRR